MLGVFDMYGLHAIGMLSSGPGCLEPEGAGRRAGRNWSPWAGGDEDSAFREGLQTDLVPLPVSCL